MKHLILGTGAAGIAAAKTIRTLRPQNEIVMLSADRQVHSRCMLHKYIAGERDAAGLRFVPEDFFETQRVRWLPGVAVEAVDPGGKTVRHSGGEEVFDRLLIATGASSAMPPIPGLEAANVHGLHSLDCARAIREAAGSAEQIVVIGAGLVGLDAAHGLLALGKEVTVVEMEPRILALNLDEQAAAEYQRRFEAHGCRFLLGRRVEEAETRENRVVALRLDDGRRLPCDLLVVAAGMRPNLAPLAHSGLAVGRGVTVDEGMATSHPDIYAAGDVTGLSGIWSSAVKQGEVAAQNMCGGTARYDDRFALKNTANFFGLLTLSLGRFQPEEGDRVLLREDRSRYEKLVHRDGVPVGLVLQGEIGSSGFWQYLIKHGIDLSGQKKPLWKVSYADYCKVDSQGEYQWAL